MWLARLDLRSGPTRLGARSRAMWLVCPDLRSDRTPWCQDLRASITPRAGRVSGPHIIGGQLDRLIVAGVQRCRRRRRRSSDTFRSMSSPSCGA